MFLVYTLNAVFFLLYWLVLLRYISLLDSVNFPLAYIRCFFQYTNFPYCLRVLECLYDSNISLNNFHFSFLLSWLVYFVYIGRNGAKTKWFIPYYLISANKRISATMSLCFLGKTINYIHLPQELILHYSILHIPQYHIYTGGLQNTTWCTSNHMSAKKVLYHLQRPRDFRYVFAEVRDFGTE